MTVAAHAYPPADGAEEKAGAHGRHSPERHGAAHREQAAEISGAAVLKSATAPPPADPEDHRVVDDRGDEKSGRALDNGRSPRALPETDE
ncbi:hypothetical protein Ade02nite_81070 [Paractinoplanes deccanensis]|uniref:Uncharacterized protein n=1 Tax=Paractinoplanes deccanensis TaxID=113561 RepID=A0ABQ3YHJ4_9ACTN|nr:hypothetical protein Ade02nite_81070 [Actinoplanes deccanensis]